MSLLHEDILNPLPGGAQGEKLRYAPIYDKIKEARVEDEDDAPQGEWERQRKKADCVAVLKLAGEALSKKSKDLQLAAWYAEALIRREGFAAVPQAIKMLHDLQAQYWDILYPELEDGSPEFRATPQEWLAGRCDYLIRRIALTKNGLDWIKYKESRSVGYEESIGADEEKKARREEAIAEKKVTGEEFDEAVASTPKSFYVAAYSDLEAAHEALVSLESFCDEKYGKLAPSFSKLRNVLEEVKQTAGILLAKKRELEPDEPQTTASTEGTPPASPEASLAASTTARAVVPAANPATAVEAFSVVARVAEYLRKLDPSAVPSYLLIRSLRWGELRSAGDSPDQSLLVAPSTELRQTLKRLCAESNWEELLSATETAATAPCGRAWLDLHRYSWQACSQLGHGAAAKAICSGVKALLADLPSLPDSALDDDTPVANSETKAWLEEQVIGTKETRIAVIQAAKPESHAPQENGSNSTFEIAAQMAREGRLAEAMEALAQHNSHEQSGRERFLRQLQVSQLCLSTGNFAIAYPILHDLSAEIERRKLLEWESTGFVVQTLVLLVQCIDQIGQDVQERSQIYNLLCRLEPAVALQLQRS